MAGETGRARFWSGGAPRDLTVEELLRRLKAPVFDQTLAAARRWLKGVPEHVLRDPADTLYLAYVEQLLGCWEANSRYLFPGRPRVISPMTSAPSLETMLRLPKAYRKRGRLQRYVVAHGWPDLLAPPINRGTGLAVRRAGGASPVSTRYVSSAINMIYRG